MNNIIIKGARVHNLKNIDVTIPRDKLVVITGLSGSGKSSLAFDTIYAEGQRRYVESLSAYARQFLGLMDKPDVDQIDGLSPAISIDQKSVSHNPRSTVGTVTEIYDYLRLLFARVGQPHCPNCGDEISKQSVEQIREKVVKMAPAKILVLSPLVRDQKGEHKKVLTEIEKAGYARVRFDGEIYTLAEAAELVVDKQKKHTLDVVVDRIELDADIKKNTDLLTRLSESLEQAVDLANGLVIIHKVDSAEDILMSEHLACPKCDISLPELEPRNFSFNSPHGACGECTGLGSKQEIDPSLIIPNPRLSIDEGAIRPWSRSAASQYWHMSKLAEVARKKGFSLSIPAGKLSKEAVDIVLYGDDEGAFEGVIPILERRYTESDSEHFRTDIESYMRRFECPKCFGQRLKPEVLGVKIADKSIAAVTSLTIDDAVVFFAELANNSALLNNRQKTIAKQILKEISSRLHFLHNVGLDYLSLNRAANTLSGGEAQRIRLATQIGSSLVGVIYILDEPSIGLHQRDNDKLIETLKQLRDMGNTVLVVEHDEDTIRAADQVIDIGPGAGEHGGLLVAQGSPAQVAKNTKSITGQYLSGKREIAEPKKYRSGNGHVVQIVEAAEFNLKNITVNIPLGKFVCVTGVSGSGKSTLVTDILSKALAQKFYQAKDAPGKHADIIGLEHIDKVITIDQSPIGRTPRSNPATYTGLFTPIRDMYAELPEAKIRGYKAGRFSFNVKGGRCEACQGEGQVSIEMQFLPDVYVDCDECHGTRYNEGAREIKYKGKDIAEVLSMNVEEARPFFANIPVIKNKLDTLFDVGLGYMHLGQPATTLSGGEAQRVKLATELARRSTGKTLYILDEPTTGLHFEDVKHLLEILQRLVDKGNTVLVIEHNLDVIKSADWLLDLGPEGGVRGGQLVAEGTPRDVAKVKGSYTGQFLKRVLK